jgi:hypothetical protein
MDGLPAALSSVLEQFSPVFGRRTWTRAQTLVVGALLCPGARTVAAALRVLGLAQERGFCAYHRVLSRARWSALALSRILLRQLVAAFVPTDAELVFAIDETLERRQGACIEAKGLFRDNARSSKAVHVKSHGLRWICVMLLARVPWATRLWALPFLTILAPPQRACQAQGRRHKRLSHWARQAMLLLRRWLPGRRIVLVGDNNYSAIELLARARRAGVTVVTRLRLDAALYDAPPTPEEFRAKHPRGRLPKKGARHPTLQARLEEPTTRWRRCTLAWYGGTTRALDVLTGTAVWYRSGLPPVLIRWVLLRDPTGKFEPQALVTNEPELGEEQIIDYFLRRWQIEVTFAEVRAHLGVETQRQWSEAAIKRTTPVLLGLFSVVALCARERPVPVRRSAWYDKPEPTFCDLLAQLRGQLWWLPIKRTSSQHDDLVMIPRHLLLHWHDALSFAA